MKYNFNGISLQNKRQSNMDSLLLKSRSIGTANATLAVVCDGVGSLIDGEFASGTAAKSLSYWFSNISTANRIGLCMRDEILSINSHIVTQAAQMNLDTATTLTALLLVEDSYYIAHIGDSRIYCYNNGNLSILTSDDISSSGKLTGYIGKTHDVFLQYSEGSAVGKTFLICSDGLYNRMSTDILIEMIQSWNKRSSNEQVDFLSNYVIERGEADNISLAFVRLES